LRKESLPICCLADSDLKSESVVAVAVDMERLLVILVGVMVLVGRVKAEQLAAAAMR